jgi:hypothetical protein
MKPLRRRIRTIFKKRAISPSITPSLVSYIANEKHYIGTPLCQQEVDFFKLSAGFPLSHVDLSNYLMKGAAILYPFYAFLKHLFIPNQGKVIHAGDKQKKEKCHMWLYATGKHDPSVCMSVIQTAKTNGLDSKKYLEHLFKHMYRIKVTEKTLKDSKVLKTTFETMEKFLSWGLEIQKRFKIKEGAR